MLTKTAVRSSTPSKTGKLKTKPISARSFEEEVDQLLDFIRNPPPTSQVVRFSPRLAEYVLTSLSAANRPLKHAKVKQYARDLSDNSWALTGDTIKFGSDGMLRDGKNRLSACVRSGRPLITHVVFGIDPQFFPRMDIGKNRTGADVFSIAGIRYANHAAAAVRWVLILTSENPGNRGAQFSNEELLRAYREKTDPDRLEHSIKRALEVQRTTRNPAGPLAALHYLFSQRDLQKADAFFEEWASGVAKRARAPTRYLQSRLVEASNAVNHRLHENVRNGLIITAWNAYVAGRSLTKAEMQHAPSDPMPAIEG